MFIIFLYAESPATRLSFDSTGSYLCVGRANGIVEIFDVPLSRRLARWKLSDENVTALTVFNPTLPILAVGIGTVVYILVVRLPSYFYDNDIEEQEGDNKKKSTSDHACPGTVDVLRALRAVHQASSDSHPTSSIKTTTGLQTTVASSSTDVWAALEMSGLDPMIMGGWTITHRSAVNDIAWHPRGLYFTTVSTEASSPSLQLGIHSLSKLKTIRPFRKNVAGRVKRAVFHPTNPSLFVAFFKGVR